MIQQIEGVITRPDGERVSFLILEDSRVQWGVPPSQLGETVDVLDAITTAVRETDFFTPERITSA
ncbi:hypothetical protein SEA_MUFASA8_63 [Arthrobacter phage Mufasa8]|uniref:Uncharacterized protein n=1 Tax=Arthrobacter phage Mufasa8 TaxID=2656526 RepID=A0A649VMQ1_9CAUD|nr:hypothetical protein HYQ08_gp063 [Arthrobacter phage Mufasa8]QGJ93511.1 hypothetical protein SEA_MUFASA8_63 [Arthrobacter phage Mufasa8]